MAEENKPKQPPVQSRPPAASPQEAALPKPVSGQKQGDASAPDISVLEARLKALEEANAVNDLTRDEVDPALPQLSEAARVSAYPELQERKEEISLQDVAGEFDLQDGEQIINNQNAYTVRGFEGGEMYLVVTTTYGNKLVKEYNPS